jgi:hypothetical protein
LQKILDKTGSINAIYLGFTVKGGNMKEIRVTIPELALIVGTRAALGGGLALLLADRISREQRKAAGWALFLVGAVTTIPLATIVLSRRR